MSGQSSVGSICISQAISCVRIVNCALKYPSVGKIKVVSQNFEFFFPQAGNEGLCQTILCFCLFE